jgi:ABC-type lipoprotein release transport system permease subunit
MPGWAIMLSTLADSLDGVAAWQELVQGFRDQLDSQRAFAVVLGVVALVAVVMLLNVLIGTVLGRKRWWRGGRDNSGAGKG